MTLVSSKQVRKSRIISASEMKNSISLFALLCIITTTSQQNCGNSVVSSGVIVEGNAIKRGQWNFMAALFYTKDDKYFCGGTLISHKHVITAAHCLQPKYWDKVLQTSEVVVHLGRYNITKKVEPEAAIHEVAEINIHPDWDKEKIAYDADLAILRLQKEKLYSQFIGIACWPTIDEIYIGEGVVVSFDYSF